MSREKLLILDFDGTLCLGDDPVLAYAAQVDELLAERGLASTLPRPVQQIVAAGLAADQLLVPEISYRADGTPEAAAQELAGRQPTAKNEAHPVSWPLQDGYQLTQLLAHQAGLTGAESGQCFRAGRRELVAAGLGATDLHAPAGAADLLAEVRRRGVVVVLITNSPAEGFAPWLQMLGLRNSFDAVINDARKPFGMPDALQRARSAGQTSIDAEHVLSVGDIWGNDLAHVSIDGGTTILLDRFGTDVGTPDYRVSAWEKAAPIIRRWAD
ncbi:HAD family hydrolase [Garicola koreensis]|uniref:HAD family hydrolase n=1 Tax=Garicola koreensis TaxID=1262554 RepID=UPI0031EB08E7